MLSPTNLFCLLKIVFTEPGEKGNTATNALKPAKTETGIEVKVPLFINEGDTVLVLEAMKMETDIRASVSGTVSEISVQAGDAVKVGDVLLTLS